jgi:hypothetical protein
MSAPDTRRPSHDALMAAQEALGNARNIEQAAGNNLVAELLNQLTLTVFKVALQDDLDEWLAAQRAGAR